MPDAQPAPPHGHTPPDVYSPARAHAPAPTGISLATVPRIGLLGVGRMGLPIAGHLAAAGFPVTAFDIDPVRESLAVARGLVLASDARAVAATADVLITVLPGPPELREAMLGADGALAALRPGTLWLDLTTNDPRVAAELATRAAARDVSVVGAPMGGGVRDADAASLRFFVGADTNAFHRVRTILDALSAPGGITHVGENVAAGVTAKLLANLLWFGQAAAVTEALLLGKSLGLSPATLGATLSTSAGGSVFISEHLDSLLRGDYLEEFGIDRVVEELDTLSALAAARGTPFETSDTVVRLHRDALARFGPVGGELLGARLLEERAGTDLRSTDREPEYRGP
jgi:3-hydroxyisobutyrate dehydrogenase